MQKPIIKVCTPEEYREVIAKKNGFTCASMASRGVTAYVAEGVKCILADSGLDKMMEGWDDQT